MCQLVIAIAVQSDNNKVYIEMIQSLSQKSQHALMVSIEEVMNHFNTEPDYASNNPRLSYLSGNSGGSGTKNFQLDDMPYRYQLEFEKVLLEKKQFETSHSQLLGEYDELRERFVSSIKLQYRDGSNVHLGRFAEWKGRLKNSIARHGWGNYTSQ